MASHKIYFQCPSCDRLHETIELLKACPCGIADDTDPFFLYCNHCDQFFETFEDYARSCAKRVYRCSNCGSCIEQVNSECCPELF